MENIIVFGAIALAVIYLARKWFGKGGGGCGCGCDCPASKSGDSCCGDTENCITDLRQK
ncbi:FeoB-associated Cys-rich membrane protein [Desulfovibrio sp. JC010]|uniref:FeoB-associated Cys-rich membrane protein n=1 Tax=Desulfovibrio sp. JC010 TaxID=2593641 RepID=UPI0013D1EE3C|nr:FeoB-associated Cys-rich membrane protein [Desulfovibrio sp. JC010]NDV25358.1 FeoB-associated Cys-rich membrane protein [Desulfovibrio sp. JC010]